MLAHLVWDPSPALFNFNLPLLGRPLLWYGFLFALGFFAGYRVLLYLLRRYFLSKAPFSTSSLDLKKKVASFADSLSFHVILGAIIGARLGDLLFYQEWNTFMRHPASILAVWEGGLASHGGAVGILIALLLFSKRQKIAFWTAVDMVVIPTALVGCFIRVGNFINQEILGTATTVPWGVIFMHPVDGGALIPRHPVQLYEALIYTAVFCILLLVWRRSPPFQIPGKMAGLFLVLIFTARFFIEFLKVEQSVSISSHSPLTMGQWLSLPFLALGVWLLMRKKRSA